MKLQKTTWTLVSVAILLSGVVYFYERQSNPQQDEVQVNQKSIFDFKKEEIQALTITTKKETLKLERTGKKDSSWQMNQPLNVTASNAVVDFLLNLLVEGKRDRTLTISPEQRKEYGLDKPFAKIDIQLKNGTNHQLILGNTDFEGQSLYAQTERGSEIILVSKDFQFAIERDLNEWKQPPEE
jgi:Domain of unknown function (DUF4340)